MTAQTKVSFGPRDAVIIDGRISCQLVTQLKTKVNVHNNGWIVDTACCL